MVLVTDGGDNCAPPDPCKAAERVAKRGVDMSISVVGFQVNDRVQRQLRCIARGGRRSYVDVDDADKLGDELLALLSRAFRSYEPAGRRSPAGRPATGDPDQHRPVPGRAAQRRDEALVRGRRPQGGGW